MYVIVTTNASAHQEGTAELRELPNTTIENRQAMGNDEVWL